MRDSTQHNEIDLLIARDEEARKDFKRLSEISQSQSGMYVDSLPRWIDK